MIAYADKHRSRAELHRIESGLDVSGVSMTSPSPKEARTSAGLQNVLVDVQSMHRLRGGDGVLQCRNSSPQRYYGSLDQGRAAYDAVDSTEEVAAAAEAHGQEMARQPFQVLQRKSPHATLPRRRASRKLFSSPHAPAAVLTAVERSTPSPRPRLVSYSGNREGSADELYARNVHQDSLVAGLRDKGRFPVKPQKASPTRQPFTSACVPESSSHHPSFSHRPASGNFTVHLEHIIATRQEIESLIQKQRLAEDDMLRAMATFDSQSSHHSLPQQQDSVSHSPKTDSVRWPPVDHGVYEQVLRERSAAFEALHHLKEKGNAIVHKLYKTVKMQQLQSLELTAMLESQTKANQKLKEALTSGTTEGQYPGAAKVSEPTSPETVTQLHAKVATQQRVIEQMDQLMQNADRMLATMRVRVEDAERRANLSETDRSGLPPLPPMPSGPPSNDVSRRGESSDARSGSERVTTTSEPAPIATPEAVAAIERLMERYSTDRDVATVSTQQQFLLHRIGQLREALKEEQTQRLHLEEVYGATSEETARNVALLEERLLRAQNLRGTTCSPNSSNTTTGRSPFRLILHTSPLKKDITGCNSEGAKDAMDEAHHTISQAPSSRSSSSSALTHNLLTDASIGDGYAHAVVAEGAYGDGRRSGSTGARRGRESTASPGQSPSVEGVAVTGSPSRPGGENVLATDHQKIRQPRVFLGRRGSVSSPFTESRVMAAEVERQLNIPVPDTSNLGVSTQGSCSSHSLSTSRRLVNYRSTRSGDTTNHTAVNSDDDDSGIGRGAKSFNAARRPTAVGTTPTAAHSPNSPLPDATTSASRSDMRQRLLLKQLQELDTIEADVSQVVRSLTTV